MTSDAFDGPFVPCPAESKGAEPYPLTQNNDSHSRLQQKLHSQNELPNVGNRQEMPSIHRDINDQLADLRDSLDKKSPVNQEQESLKSGCPSAVQQIREMNEQMLQQKLSDL